ncbi:hypothetical protein BYT27DRAFT_7194622 [Phlegmacium glaucopus]|nr:hypothetical protein BYT27DRAFT_7194622 [Phlegmacium glaucopus]
MGVSEFGVMPGYLDAAVGVGALVVYLFRRMNLLAHIIQLVYLPPPYLCRLIMSVLLLYHLQQTNSRM